jgi:hypothetical protein
MNRLLEDMVNGIHVSVEDHQYALYERQAFAHDYLQIAEPVISKHDTTTQEQDLMEKGMI